jgi:PilZ domain
MTYRMVGKVLSKTSLMPQRSAPTAVDVATVNDFHHADRRRRTRWRVQWPIQFRGGPGGPVDTLTHDLSSDGFYCLTDAPFVPGEVRLCTLSVPANHPDDLTRRIPLRCRVRVVRVEAEGGMFGIGCSIEDYQVPSLTAGGVDVPRRCESMPDRDVSPDGGWYY